MRARAWTRARLSMRFVYSIERALDSLCSSLNFHIVELRGDTTDCPTRDLI